MWQFRRNSHRYRHVRCSRNMFGMGTVAVGGIYPIYMCQDIDWKHRFILCSDHFVLIEECVTDSFAPKVTYYQDFKCKISFRCNT